MQVIEAGFSANGKKFAIVVARFNSFIVESLLDGATDTLQRIGNVAEQDITVIRVPGAFELPLAVQRVAASKELHGPTVAISTAKAELVKKLTAAAVAALDVQPAQVRVLLRERDEHSVVLGVAVQDTGVGIPAHKVDRLFKAFSQVDSSTTRQYGGSGLGLAICQRLCKAMSGKIGVTSKLGEGSTFRFTVRKDMKLNNPRGETPTHWITHGFDQDLDDAAKEAHLRTMMEQMFPGRWAQLRPMTAQELKATAILSLPLLDAAPRMNQE